MLGWVRRWWPALAPAGVSLACAVVMVSQQVEAREVRRTNQTIEKQLAEVRALVAAPDASLQAGDKTASPAMAEQEEIARLRERAAQLSNSVVRLEKLRAENQSLRQQPVTATGLSDEEVAALAKAREKAMALQCVNNLKQVCLAARVWAQDSNDIFPPNFLSMSNELGTTRILVCPADTNRSIAVSFATYSDANSSYELLAPSASDVEPQRVLTRCRLHGAVGLCEGSVHRGVANRLVEHDGKLYLRPN
jgi:hypothetical protein